jgi:hypothetical protein
VPDRTRGLLAGLDARRPLPGALRDRLEHALSEGGAGGRRPLDPGLAGRLRGALADPVAGALEGVDEARPLETTLRARLEGALLPRPRRRRFVLAAAAALAVLGAAGLALGLSGPGAGGPLRAQSGAQRLTSRAPSALHYPGTSGAGAAGGSATAGGVAPGAADQAPAAPASALPDALGPPPSVTGLSPAEGPATGGTWVTVTGSGLEQVDAVSFGGVPAAYVLVSGATLRARAPAHGAGTVDVQVAGPSGESALVPQDRFRYR